ncbi:hypothetical protein D3C81_1405080 [compost metagenome]
MNFKCKILCLLTMFHLRHIKHITRIDLEAFKWKSMQKIEHFFDGQQDSSIGYQVILLNKQIVESP